MKLAQCACWSLPQHTLPCNTRSLCCCMEGGNTNVLSIGCDHAAISKEDRGCCSDHQETLCLYSSMKEPRATHPKNPACGTSLKFAVLTILLTLSCCQCYRPVTLCCCILAPFMFLSYHRFTGVCNPASNSDLKQARNTQLLSYLW